MTFSETKITARLECMSAVTDKFKTDNLIFTFAFPRERNNQADIALLSSVLLRGTEKYPSQTLIDRKLDELYSSDIDIKFLRFGETETLNISCDFLSSRYTENNENLLGEMLDLIDQLIFHPLLDTDGFFREEVVVREKKNVSDGIKSVINYPESYAAARCLEIMKRNDKKFTTLDAALKRVESNTAKKLFSFFEKLRNASAVRVFYMGETPAAELNDKIKVLFADKFKKKAPVFLAAHADQPIKFSETFETMQLSQGKLVIGIRSGTCIVDSDFYTAVVFNEILGASPASKLFVNVREKEGLCYYCDSAYNIYSGNIMISSGIASENRERTTKAILVQLDEIKRGKFTVKEFETAKRTTVNYYRQIPDKMNETFTYYTGRLINGISESISDCTAKFAAVTKDDVIEFANRLAVDTVYFLEGSTCGGDK